MWRLKLTENKPENVRGKTRSTMADRICVVANKRSVIVIVTAVLLLLTICASLVICTYYARIPAMVNEIVREYSELKLTQIIKGFNENVLALDRLSVKLNLDREMRSLMNAETLDPEDASVKYVQNTLTQMQNENLWLHSAYVYYNKSDVIISDDMLASADRMSLAQRQSLQPTQLGEYRIMGTQIIDDASGGNKSSVISVLRYFPVFSTDCWGVVIMNIRVMSLNAQLADFAREEGGYVFLVNKNGTIELCSDTKYEKGNLNTLLKNQCMDGNPVQFADREYYVYTDQPNYFDWRLVHLYPTDALNARYVAMNSALTILGAGIVLAGILVLWAGWCFCQFISNHQRMKERMQFVTEDHRERFTESLLYGLLHNHPTAKQHCTEQMQLYGIPEHSYAAMLIVFEDRFAEDVSAQLNKIVNQHAMGKCLRWKCDAYAVVVHIPEQKLGTWQTYLTSIAEHLLSYIRKQYSYEIKAYLGSVEEHIDDIWVSLSNAAQAQNERWLMVNGSGIYCYTPCCAPANMMYSEVQAQRIFALVRGGQAEDAVSNMQRMINDLCKDNQFIPQTVKMAVDRFVTNLIQCAPTGGNLKELELLREYHAQKCLADVRIWLIELINSFCTMVRTLYNTSGSNASIEQIEQYIKANLNKDMSLTSAAEHFAISESHFSRMFKQKFGVNFLEYVNRQRIDNAKILLDVENRTVSEIARRVGFSNVQTFIRVFKSLEGMTPGVYQNMRKTIIRS